MKAKRNVTTEKKRSKVPAVLAVTGVAAFIGAAVAVYKKTAIAPVEPEDDEDDQDEEFFEKLEEELEEVVNNFCEVLGDDDEDDQDEIIPDEPEDVEGFEPTSDMEETEDDDEEPRSSEEPKVIKVLEHPDLQSLYDGSWEIIPTGDSDFDDICREGANLLDKIEEDLYIESEKDPTFEDVAYSLLNGIFFNKDDLEGKREEMLDIAKRAKELYDEEGQREKYLVASKVVRKHRGDMLEYIETVIQFLDDNVNLA